jgi:hypothetical protein
MGGERAEGLDHRHDCLLVRARARETELMEPWGPERAFVRQFGITPGRYVAAIT